MTEITYTPFCGWLMKSGQEMDYELKIQMRFADTYVAVLCVVPGRAPAVMAGAYQTVIHGSDKQKRIKLYWQVGDIYCQMNCTVSSLLDIFDAFASFVFCAYVHVLFVCVNDN